MNETNKEMFARLVVIAVGFMEGGDPVRLDDHGCIDHEYMRGQAELICEATGLPMDDKEYVMRVIVALAGLDVTS